MPLSETSVWPSFAIAAVLLMAGAAIVRWVPFYAREVAGAGEVSRTASIDGLRGLLALGVFFHHAVVTHGYYAGGSWKLPAPGFYAVLGPFGVSVFFAITAFLFTSKALRGPIDTSLFFRGRIKRLFPMYFATVFGMFVIVAFSTGFALAVPFKTLGRELLTWFTFGFMEGVDINGLPNTYVINSVFWSLGCEWLFYALLPMMAVFARGKWLWLLLAVVIVYAVILNGRTLPMYFVVGAVVAKVVVSGRWRDFMLSHAAALISLAALLLLFNGSEAGYGRNQALLVMVFFLPIAHGNGLFGVLRARALQWLGLVSYSLYLTHSLVLYVVFAVIDRSLPVHQMTPTAFWLAVSGCGLIVIALSAATYRFIEHPFLADTWRATLSSLGQLQRRRSVAL